jgi:hypothetical protein
MEEGREKGKHMKGEFKLTKIKVAFNKNSAYII